MARGAIERDAALALSNIPGRPFREKEEKMTAQSLRRLAEKYRSVTSDLGARADELTGRLEKVHGEGHGAMDAHARVLDDFESSIREVEDLTNQLSNLGPPLGGSPVPPAPGSELVGPDSNGVHVNKTA